MSEASGTIRALTQEIYLQDLVLSIYRVYAARLRDAGGRAIVEDYLSAEEDRRRRIERYLADHRASAAPLRGIFARAGGFYGRLTSLLGTRIMLRIVLSASKRASRRACAALGSAPRPDLVYLATLRARNEGDLLDALRQHLIDTRARRA